MLYDLVLRYPHIIGVERTSGGIGSIALRVRLEAPKSVIRDSKLDRVAKGNWPKDLSEVRVRKYSIGESGAGGVVRHIPVKLSSDRDWILPLRLRYVTKGTGLSGIRVREESRGTCKG